MLAERKALNEATLHSRSPRKPPPNPYRYDSLLPGEIRVLVLSPGQGEDPLRGTLEIAELNDKPRYKAISYAWGEPVFIYPLHLPQGQLFITKSLFGALNRFRSETEHVRLWADAVCINQDGITERNHQVTVMDQIFEMADEVLVWLGEAQPSDCLVLYLLESIAKLPRLHPMRGGKCPDDILMVHNRLVRTSVELPERSVCRQCLANFEVSGGRMPTSAISDFRARPWFWRLWVIQEVFFAKTYKAYFGHHSINKDVLESLWLKNFNFPGFGVHNNIHENTGECQLWDLFPLDTAITSTRDYGVPRLLEAILYTGYATCAIPHDKVYAIRRFANVKDVDMLRPDYHLAIQDLWERVAIVELTSPSLWDALESSCFSPMLTLALAGVQRRWESSVGPSWVPNLDICTYEMDRKFRFHSEQSRGNSAGGQRSMTAVVNATNHHLQLRGKSTGSIMNVCAETQYRPIFHRDSVGERATRVAYTWYTKCIQFALSQQDSTAFHSTSWTGLACQDDKANEISAIEGT